ncbi:MAG TPA: S1C family serine protease [Candidatus Acidoferrales bacterium]|nr:S1C family serine protease [Candidatus Acidoferrales bacterium]
MQQETSAGGTWQALSKETARAVEKAGGVVVAVHARRRIPSSGVHWRPGIVATANHTIERDEQIAITLPNGQRTTASLAGRDPGTDLAILKLEGADLPAPEIGDAAALEAGHWVLVTGRTREGGPRAAMALVGVAGPAWRTPRGGLVDQTLRLDRNLHPNLSGGPAVDAEGRVLGIQTAGLARFAGVVIPASTVERVTQELEKKGHIGRAYMGAGLQTVRLPQTVRESLKLANETGIIVVGVEPGGPAEKAGIALGDVIVALDGKPTEDIDDVQSFLVSERIGKQAKATVLRAGRLAEAAITVGERPAAG